MLLKANIFASNRHTLEYCQACAVCFIFHFGLYVVSSDVFVFVFLLLYFIVYSWLFCFHFVHFDIFIRLLIWLSLELPFTDPGFVRTVIFYCENFNNSR